MYTQEPAAALLAPSRRDALADVSTSGCVFHNAVVPYNMFPGRGIVLGKATAEARGEGAADAALDQLEGRHTVVNR